MSNNQGSKKATDFDEMYEGRFLKAGLFKGRDVTLTIVNVEVEALEQEKGGARKRGILYFRETDKGLVLNRTNGECLKALFGRNLTEWVGKRVTLFPAEYRNNFDPDATHAIRVRGTPELSADRVIEVKLPRKKPTKMTMRATGSGAKRAPVQAPPPEPEDDDAGRFDEPEPVTAAREPVTPPTTKKKQEPAPEQSAPDTRTATAPAPASAPATAPAKRAPSIDLPF